MTINIVEWAVENIKTWPDADDCALDLPKGYLWSSDGLLGLIVSADNSNALGYEVWSRHKSQKDIGSKIVKAIIPELLDMEANLTIQQIMQVVQAVINTCDVEVKL